MRRVTLSTTLMGKVVDIRADAAQFTIRCHSGDDFEISVGQETQFQFIRNLDGVERDRYPNPEDFCKEPSQLVKKYIQQNHLLVLEGVYLEDGETARFNARIVHVLQAYDGKFLFEDNHWWLTQIARLADTWR